jgi:hypothetical protein
MFTHRVHAEHRKRIAMIRTKDGVQRTRLDRGDGDGCYFHRPFKDALPTAAGARQIRQGAIRASEGCMKLVALLAAIAIIGFVFTRQSSPVASVERSVAEADAAAPPSPAPSPSPAPTAPATTALKRPIDRTHAALDAVKKRNGNGEF